MKYLVLSKETVIGETDLERCDEYQGVLNGAFFPLPGYEAARPVLGKSANYALMSVAERERLDADGKRQRTEWEAEVKALQLTIADQNGEPLPSLHVELLDASEELGEYDITVLTPSYETFKQIRGAGGYTVED